MRAREFISENTVSGSIATIAQPLGKIQRRVSTPVAGKYTDKTPRKKKHARG